MIIKYGINFIDDEHFRRFMFMYNKKKLHDLDKEYCAAFIVLSSTKTLFDNTIKYVNMDGINVSKLKRMNYLSTTERYLVKIACALFNSIDTLKLDFYWVVRLDEQQYSVVLEAFRIRR